MNGRLPGHPLRELVKVASGMKWEKAMHQLSLHLEVSSKLEQCFFLMCRKPQVTL